MYTPIFVTLLCRTFANMKQHNTPQLSTAAVVLFFLLSFLLFAALDPTPKTNSAGLNLATSKNSTR